MENRSWDAMELNKGPTGADKTVPMRSRYPSGDSLVNECLQQAALLDGPDRAVEYILQFVGERFQCDRCYIFEGTERSTFRNTAEWCREGVIPWKETQSEEPYQTVEAYMEAMRNGEHLLLRNVEGLRQQFPSVYACLKSRGVKGLSVCPLMLDGKLWGLFGADNPKVDQPLLLSDFMSAIGHYIIASVQQQEMLGELKWLKNHDQLTGACNRVEFDRVCHQEHHCRALGVVRACVPGLAELNARGGQRSGDRALVQSSRLLQSAFPNGELYRIGGGEFVVLCRDMAQHDFESNVQTLRMLTEGMKEYCLEVGSAWNASGLLFIQQMVSEITERMEKGPKTRSVKTALADEPLYGWNQGALRLSDNEFGTGFAEYIKDNHFDFETVIQSLAQTGLPIFLFFGDLRTNMFYVSDTLRDTFGFASNMVPDLLNVWGTRICDSNDHQRFFRNLKQVLYQRQTRHDLRYRVKDRYGKSTWVHSSALIQWDQDNRRPVFCSGLISRQDCSFVIDPVSNYPMEQAALNQLSLQYTTCEHIQVVGFSLNSFSEINRTLGRGKADRLIRDFANHLVISFGDQVNLFRLDGLRFIAILDQNCPLEAEDIGRQIRDTAKIIYRRYGVTVRTPCSVGLLRYPDAGESGDEFIEEAIALISLAKNSAEKEFVVHTCQSTREQRERAQLALELNKCVLDDFGGFRVVVQPIVDAHTGKIQGGETLLRWNNGGKDVSPGIFIPMLEDNKLILLVGKWIFEQAVRACGRILTYKPDFHLSFNVSYLQILDDTFLPFMKNTLERYGIDGRHLIMELTETHYDEAPEKLANFVKGCRELGMSIALDDFGNGYSSLALLLKYPADIIKLDRELVSKVTQSDDNLKIIHMIVYSCQRFGKQICAEGVETEAELEIVRSAGCDMIQGYYFHGPKELGDLFDLLARESE